MYFVGVGIGLIAVYFFFGDRDLDNWTPQSRVMNGIDSAEVKISERALCQMSCLNLKANEIDSVRALAKVNFSESSPQKKPCPIYRLSSQWRTRDYQLFYELCEIEEKAELISVIQIGKTCDCPQ
jgi:hypothetical protein